jgi:hypothetical protein
MFFHRNRKNRTGVPIQVNDGLMFELAAIVSEPIGDKAQSKR